MHPRAKIAVGKGTNDKVNMVRHQAPGEQSHGALASGTFEETRKRVEIIVVMENSLSGIASG